MSYTTVANVRSRVGVSSSAVSDADVTTMIEWGDAMIDKRTGKSWNTPTTRTDYFDVHEREAHKDWDDEEGLVTPDKPFFDKFNTFSLVKSPVTSVSHVYVLNKGASVDKLFSYDDSADSYTNNSSEAESVKGTPFYAFASAVGVGDIMYVGLSDRFLAIFIDLSTAGSGGTCVWEYYDGSGWTTLTVTESASGADDLNASGKISWSLPGDWEENTVNSVEKYWVRVRVTSAHSTSPKVNYVVPEGNSVIDEELTPAEYDYSTGGRLVLRDDYLSDEWSGVRVDYYYGADSVPTVVEELSTVLASKKVMEKLMGGSYDDAASYQVGDMQISKGEPYTNLQATIRELEKTEELLWKQLGFKGTVMFT